MITLLQNYNKLDSIDARRPLFQVSMNLNISAQPSSQPFSQINSCRATAVNPTTIAAITPPDSPERAKEQEEEEEEDEEELERIAEYRCEWRECNALLFTSSILRKHVRQVHCTQSVKAVSTSKVYLLFTHTDCS